MRSQRLNDKLTDALSPVYLEIEDESGNHNVPEGSESHFKVLAVSDKFQSMSKIERHQKIYSLLNDEFRIGLHALSIRAYTYSEWAKQKQDRPSFTSPECLGGSAGKQIKD